MSANRLVFKFVPKEICEKWEKNGKTQIISKCEEFLKSQKNSTELMEGKDVRRILYEIVRQILLKTLKSEHLVSVISTLKEKYPEICSMIVDVFSLIDIEVTTGEKNIREKFIITIATCKEVIGATLLKERLDVETLEALNLVSNTKMFQQKYIKTKTRLFYKQQKFNLLREEMEGYSKLAIELGQLENRDKGAENFLENIKSLIGCFNIDPNRVLDIILESFECHPKFASSIFVPLLQNYLVLCEKSTLCQLLGFKFAHYQTVGVKTPKSLYTVAALLMQRDLVDLEDILVHLLPEDEVLKSEWTKIVEDAIETVRKANIVTLSNSDKKEEKEEKPIPPKMENQKFGLCEGLLRVGDWQHAKEIMDKYDSNHMMSGDSFVEAICELLAATIDPFYRRVASVKGSLPLPHTVLEHGELAPPRVKEYEDLTEHVFDMLDRIGPKISHDPLAMAKIVRIGRMFFYEYYEAEEMKRTKWSKVFGGFLGAASNCFLPALSLLKCNANMSQEVWVMLRMLPYQIRYRLYGEWKNDAYDRHPEMMLVRAKTIDQTKYIMRRLTKENVKQSGRQMGKLSHGNPMVLFESILSQIQRYDNMINPVVDAFKYLADLSYDALSFSIIEALANPLKERMKYDDTNISDWLQSLASFSGAVFKKYSIELSGLLQYVANQLKAGKSLDLLILKEVVQRMSGVEISEEVTRDQLEALSGGELLKAEGGYFGQIRNTKKSSNRLKDSLLGQKLELPMCILIAQHRYAIVFKEGEEKHLKLVGKLTDQCHDTLVQFGNFLAIHLSMDEYVKRFPPIDVLISDYHTPPDVAFFLSRPMYTHQISSKYDEIRRSEKSKQKSSSQEKNQRYLTSCTTLMTPIIELVKTTQTEKIWQDISPQFYTTFWSLSLYDIIVPTEAYEREITKLKQQIETIQQEGSHDTRKRRERERCDSLIAKLKEEQRKQEDHKARIRARIKFEREGWFLSKSSKNDAITKFLQLCVFPRSVFSPLDAVYCAKFIQIMHLLKTPNFSTLLCFDRVFSDISYTISCLTENEASRYGRFLCSMLEIVMKWHKEKEVYDKECRNYPGFVTVLRTNATDGASKANHLDYENFRHVCHKWQFKLTKAIVVCLDSKEYCSIRNALIILTKILLYFPMVTSLATALEKRVDKIKEEKEKRPDLYALAMGCSGQLRARRPFMVPEHEFHQKDQNTKQQNRTQTEKKLSKDSTKAPDSVLATKPTTTKIEFKEVESKREKSISKEKKEVTISERSKSKDRAKSKDKSLTEGKSHRASSTGKQNEREHKRSSLGNSSVIKSPVKVRSESASRSVDNDDRERKRRKVDQTNSANHVKGERVGRKDKSEKRSKSSSRDDGLEDRKSSGGKKHDSSTNKRMKTENGDDRRSKEKEKHKRSDTSEKLKKESHNERSREHGSSRHDRDHGTKSR